MRAHQKGSGPSTVLVLAVTLLASTIPASFEARAVGSRRQEEGGERLRGYYLDTGCEDCAPREGDARGRYWVITAEVCSATADTFDGTVARFRRFLGNRFADGDRLAETVVLRFRDTVEEAERGRNAKIRKMAEQGYTIVETAFPCSPESGDPSVADRVAGGAKGMPGPLAPPDDRTASRP